MFTEHRGVLKCHQADTTRHQCLEGKERRGLPHSPRCPVSAIHKNMGDAKLDDALESSEGARDDATRIDRNVLKGCEP